MKKFTVGLLLGIGLAFAFSAQAEEIKSLIGAKIEGQFPVTVNGQTIDNPGIVVGGVSYLPTRKIAELAGFDVSFDADLGIRLTKKSSPEQVKVEDVVQIDDKQSIERRIKEIEHEMTMIRDRHIYMLDIAINNPQTTEEGKQEALQKKAELEARLSQLQAEKAELEAQLATTPE